MSRDLIGLPYTYVSTKTFLSQFGPDTLRQLPDSEVLEDVGLLAKEKLLASDITTLCLGFQIAMTNGLSKESRVAPSR